MVSLAKYNGILGLFPMGKPYIIRQMINRLQNAVIFIIFSVLSTSIAFAADTLTNANSDNQSLQEILNLPSDTESTALSQRVMSEKQVENNPFGLLMYKPMYILPFYYTQSPLQTDNTPLGQRIESEEFKGQISFQAPIVYQAFGPKNTLSVAYTQLSYWQVYAASQYFRICKLIISIGKWVPSINLMVKVVQKSVAGIDFMVRLIYRVKIGYLR
jgi:outer membrane phospholipase A